jgi:hypothetical protein
VYAFNIVDIAVILLESTEVERLNPLPVVSPRVGTVMVEGVAIAADIISFFPCGLDGHRHS